MKKSLKLTRNNSTADVLTDSQNVAFKWSSYSTGTDKIIISLCYHGAYGMGEKFDYINQKGKRVVNQVEEKFCNQGDKTYCSIPFFVTDVGIGVYVKTNIKTEFDFENDHIELLIPENTVIEVYTGSFQQIISEFVETTGSVKAPPRFAFGPWVSANHWNTQDDVERVRQELHKYRFPSTVIVLEAWSDEATFYIFNGAKYKTKNGANSFSYEDFDFSESKYWNDPRAMISELHDEGIHTVLWQIPVYKKMEDGRFNAQNETDTEDAIKRKLCVFTDDGSPYRIPEGNWFAGSVIPDFTNAETVRTWFARRKYLLDIGVDGFKTDGGEFIYQNSLKFSNGDSGKEEKNAYCQNYTGAYHDFIGKDKILFSRAGSTGTQITTILWAGDHQSTDDELKNVYRSAMSAACSGITYWSFDIGGFAGKLPSLDLYRRATEFACFCPIMQFHSEPDGGQFKEIMPGAEGNNERTPWNIAMINDTPQFIDEMRYWYNLRMLLIPYICSEAEKSVRSRIPMMRPLFFEAPYCDVAEYENEYFFGESLLVAPLLEKDETRRSVYLPEGVWYGFFSGKKYYGKAVIDSVNERFPVFIKADKAMVLKDSIDKLDDPEWAADNRVNELNHLLLVTASEEGSYEFYDENGIEKLSWNKCEKLHGDEKNLINRVIAINSYK